MNTIGRFSLKILLFALILFVYFLIGRLAPTPIIGSMTSGLFYLLTVVLVLLFLLLWQEWREIKIKLRRK